MTWIIWITTEIGIAKKLCEEGVWLEMNLKNVDLEMAWAAYQEI